MSAPGDHRPDEGDPGRAPLDRVVDEEEPGKVVELNSLPGQRRAEPVLPEGGEGFGVRRGGEPPGGCVERLRPGDELEMRGDDHCLGHRTEHRLPVEAEADAPGSGSAGQEKSGGEGGTGPAEDRHSEPRKRRRAARSPASSSR